ncbi:MAG: radical SAM protein [Candidatus Omnitrophota bacterium]|jgi:MoaA/NifB/PqqE/SkfB family radical SAM enzyme
MEDKKAEINLGFLCNNRCKFCMSDVPREEQKFIPVTEVKKELLDFYKQGYRMIGFLGGEPTLYPHLVESILFARKLGFQGVYLVSNGRRYSDAVFLKKIIQAGASRFYISIHSHKAATEDFLTAVKGGFSEKTQGLRYLAILRKKGIIKDNILLNIVINKLNYRDLSKMIRFFSQKFQLRDFRLNFINPEGRGRRNFDLLVPRYTAIKKHLTAAVGLAKKMKLNLTVGDIPFCILAGIPNFQGIVGEFKDGQRKTAIGTRGRESFFIEKRRRRDSKIKFACCKICVYNLYCEGAWKYYTKQFGVKEFKAITVPHKNN